MKRASSCFSQLLLGHFTLKHCVQFSDCSLCYISVNTLYMGICVMLRDMLKIALFIIRGDVILSFVPVVSLGRHYIAINVAQS